MRLTFPQLLLALLLTTLAGCGGPVKRVYPPQATLQQLTVMPDGTWLLKLRVQNFSEVAMDFDHIEADLQISSIAAGHVDLQSAVSVGPGSTEIVDYPLPPLAPAALELNARVSKGYTVRYRLTGQIHSATPRGNYPFEYESALSPTPGLPGVLR